MGLTFTVHTSGFGALARRLVSSADAASVALATEVMADTEKYVPMLTGDFVQRTQAVGKYIIYPGPFARYLYNGKVMVNAATGQGPRRIVDRNGNVYIRFPKGSKLKATDRDLVFRRDYHPNATARWFEVSKAQNLKKWEKSAGKLMKNELKHKR